MVRTQNQESTSTSMASSYSIPCGYCQKGFNSAVGLLRHNIEKPIFCSKNNYCTTESGCSICSICSGSGEHQRKEASQSSLKHKCKFCKTEYNSSAELYQHHTEKPIFCATSLFCITDGRCFRCGGNGVHFPKDSDRKWMIDLYGYMPSFV